MLEVFPVCRGSIYFERSTFSQNSQSIVSESRKGVANSLNDGQNLFRFMLLETTVKEFISVMFSQK